MKRATHLATLVLAATALSGCQSISNFFAFNKGRAEAPLATNAVFGAEELENGRAALRAGYPARAIEQFRLAALNEEVSADAFNGMAVAYTKLGRADLAERYFKMAVTIDSSNPRYAANLARFYGSDLGQSQRALAMREAEAKAVLAKAEKAAVSQGLLEEPAPVQRIGSVTIEPAKPLSITRAPNRELRVATSRSVVENADSLAEVSARRTAETLTQDALAATDEEESAKAIVRKRRPTVISMLGLGGEVRNKSVRIHVSKPGSQVATRPRARTYPVRITLNKASGNE